MFYQVQNQKLKRNNQFRVQTIPAGLKEIKAKGWNIADCKFEQLREELVKNNYNILDGRNNTRGKQFKNRANKTHRIVSI
tara:strand:- start:759 stop:998 length:240 start_codon:yes stop_codon:yes gene_type:complete